MSKHLYTCIYINIHICMFIYTYIYKCACNSSALRKWAQVIATRVRARKYSEDLYIHTWYMSTVYTYVHPQMGTAYCIWSVVQSHFSTSNSFLNSCTQVFRIFGNTYMVYVYIHVCIHMYTLKWVQPIALEVSFNLILESQSNWSLFTGTWHKRLRELEGRITI